MLDPNVYSPCPGCLNSPPWSARWSRRWTCWRCYCYHQHPVHFYPRPSRLSPSLSASCLSDMRCICGRSCRIARVPETGKMSVRSIQSDCCSFPWEQMAKLNIYGEKCKKLNWNVDLRSGLMFGWLASIRTVEQVSVKIYLIFMFSHLGFSLKTCFVTRNATSKLSNSLTILRQWLLYAEWSESDGA